MRISDWSSDVCSSDLPAFGSLPLSDPAFGRRIDGALRGPLSRIIATAETISGQFDGPIRADYARYAGDIAHAGRHLLGLVDDLADLQNIERPGFKAARDEIDLGDLARRPVGLLGMKIGRGAGRERVWQYVMVSVVAGLFKKKNK